MIPRRVLFAGCAVFLPACRTRPDAAALLPETAGAWRRTAQRELPPASAPDPLTPAAVRSAVQADYAGPAPVQVTLCQLSSSAAALDAVQRFRPAPDTVFFHRDDRFVVVKWQGVPDRKALGDFIRAIEKAAARK